MADNSVRTPGSGETLRTVDNGGIKTEVVKIDWASGAEDLTGPVRAEDAGHTTGDRGIHNLSVRQDVLASSTNADGDYSSMKSNSLGQLYTLPGLIVATFRPTITGSTSAYAVNDCFGGEVKVDQAAARANGTGRIVAASFTNRTATAIAADMYICQADPTFAGADNAAFDWTDANMEAARVCGKITFTTWESTASNVFSFGSNQGNSLSETPIFFRCQDGTDTDAIWFQIVTRTAITLGANTDALVELLIVQDP